jgi:predicted secreted protein
MKPRLLLVIPVLALATVSLTACGSATSYSSRCDNNVCTVSLSGAGATAEIANDTITVELISSSGGSAEFAVDGAAATCAQGEEQEVAGYHVLCTEVSENKLTVEIS